MRIIGTLLTPPAGSYTIYFAVDLKMDSQVNDPLYYDFVTVNVR